MVRTQCFQYEVLLYNMVAAGHVQTIKVKLKIQFHGYISYISSAFNSYSCMWFGVAQMVKNLPALQEIQVLFLDQEDLLKKVMATHCSILAWRIPWFGATTVTDAEL